MGKKKRISIPDDSWGCYQDTGSETRCEILQKGKEKRDVIVGLDISTTVTGFCVLDAKDCSLIKLLPIKLNNIEDFWDKTKYINNFFKKEIDDNWNIKYLAVEESFKRFRAGSSNANTLIKLSNFNSIVCYMFFNEHNLKPTYINVNTARKKVGIKIIKSEDKKQKTDVKKQILDFVYDNNKHFPWIFKKRKGVEELIKINQDLADAFVISKACKLIYGS